MIEAPMSVQQHPQYPPPPIKHPSWFRRHPIATGLLIAFALGSIGSAMDSDSTTTTSVRSRTPAATAPVIALDAPTSGSTVSGIDTAMLVWLNKAGPIVGDITEHMRDIGNAGGTGSLSDVRVGCSTLKSDAARYAATLPTPIPELTTEARAQVHYLDAAASACLAGDYDSAAVNILEASTHTERATAILSRYAD